MTTLNLTMSVGRDYRVHGKYEFVIYNGEQIVCREGFFRSSTAAKRAGQKAADRLLSKVEG